MVLILKTNELLTLIGELQALEAKQDLRSQRNLLQSYWQDFTLPPDIKLLQTSENHIEFLRLCGFFLYNYGHSIKNQAYIDHGKDLISKVMRLFEEMGSIDKFASCACQLALVYLNEGEYDNAEDILNYAEFQLSKKASHSFVLIQINKLIILKKTKRFELAQSLVEDLLELFKSIEDQKLLYMFHFEVGLFFRLLKDYEKTIWHYLKAVTYAAALGNDRDVAKVHNNLAYCFLYQQNLERAEEHSNYSITIANRINDLVNLANFYDTFALIKLELKKSIEAEMAIEKALDILGSDGDPVLLADALLTKAKIYISQNKIDKTLEVKEVLIKTVRAKIGYQAAELYLKEFESYLRGKPFEVEILGRCEIEIFEFPGITNLKEEKYKLYFLPERFAVNIGLDFDCVIAIKTGVFELDEPNLIYHKETNTLEVGIIERNEWCGVYTYDKPDGETVFLEAKKIKMAKIVGYCPFSEVIGSNINFYAA